MSRIRFDYVTEPGSPPANKLHIYVDTADGRLKSKDSSGFIRILDSVTAADFANFANDAAYVAQYGGPVEGNAYWNTTTKALRAYNGTSWTEYIVPGAYPFNQQVWVSGDGGSDAQGEVGRIDLPFQTIQAAIDAITDASAVKPYTVNISSGIYTENITAKNYVCLQGCAKDCVVISGTNSTLLTLPDIECSVRGLTLSLAPTASVTSVISLPNGGLHTVDDIDIKITSATAGISVTIIDMGNGATPTEMIARSTFFLIQLTGTAAGSQTHKVINLHDDASLLLVDNTTGFFFDDVDDDLYYIYDNTDAQFSAVNSNVYLLNSNAAYSGTIYGYKSFLNTSLDKTFRGAELLLQSAGTGNGRAFETDTGAGVNVNVLSTDINIKNFSDSLAAKTLGASDVINFSFCTIEDGDGLFDDTVGTINRVYTKDSDLIVNTNVVDTNLYLDGATNTSLGDLFNINFSAGWVSGGEITDNLDGSVQIAAGTGIIRTSDDEQAPIQSFDWAADLTVALTDGVANLIYIDYNAGAPQVAVTTTFDTVLDNENDVFELYSVVREGTTLHISEHKHRAKNVPSKLQQYLYERNNIERTSGLIIGETGTRNVTTTAGILWVKLQDTAISALDTSGVDTFDRYYTTDSGATWTKTTGQTQWDNTNYNDITTGLVDMTVGRYSYQDFYTDMDGELVSIYGQAQYVSLAAAENAPASSILPVRISDHAILIGRIVYQKNDATAQTILSAFTTTFSAAGVTDHGTLSGLSDDDHLQYGLLAGRLGGQTLIGGTNVGDDLTLQSTSNATRGNIIIPDGVQVTIPDTQNQIGLVINQNDVTNNPIALQINNSGTGKSLGVSGISDLDGAVTINETGADVDFRVEASGVANALFVQGSDGKVGIGTDTPVFELDVVGNIGIDSTPAADHTSNGITTVMTVDANTYGISSALHMDSDGNWIEANAGAATTMPVGALALETGTGSKKVLLQGIMRDDTWAWTPGAIIYMSTTTGTLTATAPSGSGEQVQVIGFATTADAIYFNPSYNLVEIA